MSTEQREAYLAEHRIASNKRYVLFDDSLLQCMIPSFVSMVLTVFFFADLILDLLVRLRYLLFVCSISALLRV